MNGVMDATAGKSLDNDDAQIVLSAVERAARALKVPPGLDTDDLISAGNEAVARKYPSYDPARSSLSTWAAMVGQCAMRDVIRAQRRARTKSHRYAASGGVSEFVDATDDLITVAEGIRERCREAFAGEKPSLGGRGIGREARLAIALLCAHTGWSSRRMAMTLREDQALREALGVPRAPGFRTVAWCGSVCAFMAIFQKMLR